MIERDQPEPPRSPAPRGILFLCITNSARSQVAEAIARSIAPPGMRVFSAGSVLKPVNPVAVRVLDEIGIDIAAARPKLVSEIPAEAIDLVITLCSEDVGPLFQGDARSIHWAFPDPEVAGGGEAVQLELFRSLRDQLVVKISRLFDTWTPPPRA